MKLRWKVLLWIGLPVLALSLYCVIQRITAKAALERYKAELIAKGEKLTVAELIPPPIPHAENGAQDFLNASAYLVSIPYKVQPPVMSMTGPGRARVSWQRRVLPSSDSSNVWPGLKAHFQTNGSYLADVRKTVSERFLRFAVDYHQGFENLPTTHLSKLRACSQSFSAAAVLGMHESNSTEAFGNLQGLIAFLRFYEGEAVLIMQMVRAAMIAISASATWEGLHYDGFSEAQLAELQRQWDSIPILSRMTSCVELERVWILQEFKRCREKPDRIQDLSRGFMATNPFDDISELPQNILQNPNEVWNAAVDRFPRRWAWQGWNSYRDELWLLRFFQLHLEKARALQSADALFPILDRLELEQTGFGSPAGSLLLSRLLGSDAWKKFIQRIATAETQRRIVVAAIALRRYQKRHNNPAPHLSALCPDFLASLPLDPIDGQPLRYKLNSDGTFLLYSIGLNGKDEGGDASGSNSQFWWTSGNDWVWPTPASEQEVKDYELRKERERKPGSR